MKEKFVLKGFTETNSPVYYVRTYPGNVKGWIVRELSEVLDGATFYNSSEEAEKVLNEINDPILKVYPICPICHRDYSGYPAISRKDNKTRICSRCGTNEALTIFVQK